MYFFICYRRRSHVLFVYLTGRRFAAGALVASDKVTQKLLVFGKPSRKKVSVKLDADLFACVVKTPSTAGRWLICSTLVSDCRTSK